ncbi:MAG: FAD-binding oxidoreductase [Paracoccaceae bacterium]
MAAACRTLPVRPEDADPSRHQGKIPGRQPALRRRALHARGRPRGATNGGASNRGGGAGASILTECAVRGVETSGGAVSGVMTERGPIGCTSVVLAGGAWSNLFCGNLGIDLPQLGVVSHVLRTKPIEGGPEEAVWCGDFAIRKRLDGGYTISRGSGNTVDIVPDSFKYGVRFLSAFRMQRRELHLRLTGRFFHELTRPKRWNLNEPSPFEYERVFDPKPSKSMLKDLLGAVAKKFPALAAAEIEQSWGGCIDVTPDAIPVISSVDSTPGFHIATGFSGHGFGIGPGAGRLMADIVTNATPCVDPKEFRFTRFTDGSKVAPDNGF